MGIQGRCWRLWSFMGGSGRSEWVMEWIRSQK